MFKKLNESKVNMVKTALTITRKTQYTKATTGETGVYYEAQNAVGSIHKMFVLDSAGVKPMEVGKTYLVRGTSYPVTSVYEGKTFTTTQVTPLEIEG